jgi:hypothetical protein
MKVLLLHPKDSIEDARWSTHSWDRIVDLGVSSKERSAGYEKKFHCAVHPLHSLRQRDQDFERTRQILDADCGKLIDQLGLDWWRISSILLHEQLETILLVKKLQKDLAGCRELYASRLEWPVPSIARTLGCNVRLLGDERQTGIASALMRSARAMRRLSFLQLKDVLFDKYDPNYRWRSRFCRSVSHQDVPVVVVPTAYTNVSRMAAAYARLLPKQQFLFVATRYSALTFDRPSNVSIASLAAFTRSKSQESESSALIGKFDAVLKELRQIPEIAELESAGALKRFPSLLRQHLVMRDAWSEVLARHQVTAVLCGDDSNPATRIPVDLAKTLGIKTVNFHHGALDGRYLFKRMLCDVYLAKSEMERDYLLNICRVPTEKVKMGAPHRVLRRKRSASSASLIFFFSEPYENNGARPSDIYAEILVPLAALARSTRTRLVIKLHPFESKSERLQLLRKLLSAQDLEQIDVIDGPMPKDLAGVAWFGVTVESTAALDCTQEGVTCFLCAWLEISPYGYVQQYARFGVGQILTAANEISSIPDRLAARQNDSLPNERSWDPISPEDLGTYLVGPTTGVVEDDHALVQPTPVGVGVSLE